MAIDHFASIKKEKRIYLDREILRGDYSPKDLSEIVHRDDIITAYKNYVKESLYGNAPEPIFLYGLPGLGKTMVTRVLLNTLVESAKMEDIYIYAIYINCEETHSTLGVLEKIIRKLEIINNIPMKKLPTDHGIYFKHMYDLLKECNGIVFVVFDEINKLDNPDTIINRFIRSRADDNINNLCLVGITNRSYFKDGLDPSTRSVLSSNEIIFTPYDAEQLTDILESRKKLAFQENVMDDAVIPLCAALAAQEDGDARKAIELLRTAGDIAQDNQQSVATEENVYQARDKLRSDHAIIITRTLPTQKKVVLLACIYLTESNKPVTTGSVYDKYVEFCGHVFVSPLTMRRIGDLIKELSLIELITTQNTVGIGKKGRTKSIYIRSNVRDLIDAIDTDESVKSLIQYIPNSTVKDQQISDFVDK